MTLKETLRQKFVYVDEVADILTLGKNTKKNVFLYGRGGHGKSQIIEEFLKYIDPSGEESFVQACGEGLTTEKLFGGMDLKKFQQTGEVEYLVKNSFMNKKYVVFEELLDSRMNVLLDLKDILTSGKFRQGKQQFPIRTEFVVVLTNRTKQEVSEDNSVKALLERFPLEMKVEWDRYESQDYSSMFTTVLGDDLKNVADICHAINEHGDFVSPRTAVHMAQVYSNTMNVNDLKYFGASKEIIEKMKKLEEDKNNLLLFTRSRDSLDDIVRHYNSEDINSCKVALLAMKKIMHSIEDRSYSDTVYSTFCDLRSEVTGSMESLKQVIINIIENE